MMKEKESKFLIFCHVLKNKILNDENLDLVKQSLKSNDFIILYDKEAIPTQLIDILSAWEKRFYSGETLDAVQQSTKCSEYIIVSNDKERSQDEIIDIIPLWNSVNFSIANPNEDYNSTDCLAPSLPNRQLISIFQNKDFFILHYKHGGIGHHHHIIWCSIQNNKISDIWICNTFNLIDNLPELKKEIENFTRTISLKNGKTIKQNYLCY